VILAQEQHFEDAAVAFRHAYQLDPMDVPSVNNLAQSLWLLGRRDEAIREFRVMTTMKPDSIIAWISLGQSLEDMGHKAAADDCYHKALACRGNTEPELIALAHFCRSRGWLDAAATNYNAAVKLKPKDANLRIEAGQNLLVLGLYSDAAPHLAEAVRLAPESAKAHLFYGMALRQTGRANEAEDQFREALRLQPELLDARVNLGVTLMKEGRSSEALSQFDAVLQQSPSNRLALEYSQTLRSQLVPSAAH
jgi:Flp pilus assembly protein TadD